MVLLCTKTKILRALSFVRHNSTIGPKFKMALIQMGVEKIKAKNIKHAAYLTETAVKKGAQVVALPECFNSPYGPRYFKKYCEEIPEGQTCKTLSNLARNFNIYLIGGTIPESFHDKIYNTCTVWSPQGELVAKYQKLHLYDVDIPNKITFQESKVLKPGNNFATFQIDQIKVGIAICYDLRFEELAKVYRKQGVDIIVYPAAFNVQTGPLHWKNLQIGRAIDNQVYIIAVSPARNVKGYIAYGHSIVTNPWGKVIAEAGIKEEIVYADIDVDECKKVREQIPVFQQRRVDLYDTKP